jgi:hypothetical protein
MTAICDEAILKQRERNAREALAMQFDSDRESVLFAFRWRLVLIFARQRRARFIAGRRMERR